MEARCLRLSDRMIAFRQHIDHAFVGEFCGKVTWSAGSEFANLGHHAMPLLRNVPGPDSLLTVFLYTKSWCVCRDNDFRCSVPSSDPLSKSQYLENRHCLWPHKLRELQLRMLFVQLSWHGYPVRSDSWWNYHRSLKKRSRRKWRLWRLWMLQRSQLHESNQGLGWRHFDRMIDADRLEVIDEMISKRCEWIWLFFEDGCIGLLVIYNSTKWEVS